MVAAARRNHTADDTFTHCESFAFRIGCRPTSQRRDTALRSSAQRFVDRLFHAHARELRVYLTRRLSNAEVAAELTQEVFVKLLEQRRRHPEATVTHERSYLYRMAHNLAVDHLRRRVPESGGEEELAALEAEAPSPERTAAGRRELELVRRAILELPDRTRQIFVLARIEGQSYRAIAVRLGISESSVQKHLAKAVAHVMQRRRDG